MAALKLLVVAALVVSAASLTVKRDAASSQRQKKSCSYPGCGTAEEPISKEDQNAAMMDKQQRAADTAMQTAGRPGVAPFTVNTAPFPAAVYGKDKQKKMAGKHTDMVHHAKEALKTLFVQESSKSQRQKKSCSYPGCGTAEEPISKEDQNAAMMDKQMRAADTAKQTAGRPGVAPFTVNTAPFPAAVYGKDKQKKMAGKHADTVHH
eukprot:g5215.t1